MYVSSIIEVGYLYPLLTRRPLPPLLFPPSPNVHIQSAVESAVTSLLTSVRDLLESLTKWSEREITGLDVSDVYVQLGSEFNAVVDVFAAHDVGMRLVPLFPIIFFLQPKPPPLLKHARDLGSSFLSPKIYETSWNPV